DSGDVGADTASESSIVPDPDVGEILVGTPDQSGNATAPMIAVNPTGPVTIPVVDKTAAEVPPGAPSAATRSTPPADIPMPSDAAAAVSARATTPSEEPAKVAVATANVVGRETHLAPQREAAMLAGQLQKGSNSATGLPAIHEAGSSGAEPKAP